MALLGSMMISPDCIPEVLELVPESSYFFHPDHQIIFPLLVELGDDAMKKATSNDGVILVNTLATRGQLEESGGSDYLDELMNSVPTATNALHYAAIVRQKAISRQMIAAGERIARMGYDGDIDAADLTERAGKEIYNIASNVSVASAATPLVDILHEVFARLDVQNGEALSGLPTGIRYLDELTCGLQRGEFIVIGARPSVGKTALALGMMELLAVNLQKPVLFYTLEMSKLQLSQRLMASRSGVDMQKIKRNNLTSDERARVSQAVGELSAAPIFIDDTPAITINEIRARSRKAKLKHKIELIIVDYIQLCEGRGDIREQQVSSVGRGLKAIARELDVPVIGLAQLNRESEKGDRRPRSSDLRESGSLEQDADVVMLIHREAVAHRGDEQWVMANDKILNLAELIITKQRQGPCGMVKLTYVDREVKFYDYAPPGV